MNAAKLTESQQDAPSRPWLIRVALKTTQPTSADHKSWLNEPSSYYKGAMPVFAGIGGTDVKPNWTSTTSPVTTEAWQSKFENKQRPWHFSSPSSIVKRIFEDERAAVIKLALRREVESAYCTMSLHVLDLDSPMTVEQKARISSWIHKTQPTLAQLFAEFPGFEKQFKFGQQLVSSALQRGATDAFLISTGCKGFRVCVTAPELYCKASTAEIKGIDNIKKAFSPTLCEYFGVTPAQLDESLDWSIWGDNKGVRSNLHPHAATQLHPLVLSHGGLYGSIKRDPTTHARIQKVWESILQNIPEDEQKDWSKTVLAVPTTKPAVANKKAKATVQVSKTDNVHVQAMDEPLFFEENGNAEKRENLQNIENDKFEDITKYLQVQGWAAQQSSLLRAKPGSRYVTVKLMGSGAGAKNPFVCPTQGRPHRSNNGTITFDRSMALVQFGCMDGDCAEERTAPEWMAMSSQSPGASQLIKLLVAGGLKNHFDLAELLASDLKQVMVFDTVALGWRVCDLSRGTWKLVSTDFEALMRLRQVLKKHIQQAIEMCDEVASKLPFGSEARKQVPCVVLRNHLQLSGAVNVLTNIANAAKSFLSVGRSEWEKYFRGYLPVANCLLHLDASSGATTALPYEPRYFIRQEYQASVKWEGHTRNFQRSATAAQSSGSSIQAAKAWLLVCNRWKRDKTIELPDAAKQIILQNLIASDVVLARKFAASRMEATLKEWWTDEERLSWLEMTAYGLSRSAFAEVFYAIEGRPGSAKSTYATWMQQVYGPNNILIQNCNLISSVSSATKHDNDGSGHSSNIMALFDKAMVFFEEPAENSYFRQSLVKSLSGSSQSGRAAHAKQIESVVRLFLMIVIGNFVPKPEDPTDESLKSRTRWITTTNVFVRSAEHKQSLEAQLTPEQLKSTVWINADKVKLESVLTDPLCQSYMLALIAAAWKRLVHDQRRQFTTTQIAKRRLDDYFQSSRHNQNTGVAFFDQQLCIQSNTHIPKNALFQMYEDWFASQQDAQGFAVNQKLSKLKFLETIKTTVGQIHSVKECERKTWVEDQGVYINKRSVRCFQGIGFKNDPLADFLNDKRYISFDANEDADSLVKDRDLKAAFAEYLKSNERENDFPTIELIVQAYYRICDPLLNSSISIRKEEDGLALLGVRLLGPTINAASVAAKSEVCQINEAL